MLNKHLLLAALAAAMLPTPEVHGQAATWRVVAGQSGSIVTPDLPVGVDRSFTDYWLGDAGAGLLGLRVTSPSASAGYWGRTPAGLKRYVQAGVTGNLGPGRTGAEAGHVFRSYSPGWGGAAPDGQRLVLARAGDPSLPETAASYGLWRWDGVRNVEIARSFTDDAVLGPGLGDDWVFPDSSSFASGRIMSGGQVLYVGLVNTPTGATRDLVAKHVPGAGNRPCALEDSTDPALSPGLVAGDTFPADWNGSLSMFSVTADARVYATLSASGSRGGVWELCDGAPRAIAADEETGARGPAIGIATAYFTTFHGPPVPGEGDTFFFVATGREFANGPSFGGLFVHDGSSNRPLALNGSTGLHSPHWQNATFNGVHESTLTAAGEYAAFEATLSTSDGGNPDGIFRVHADGVPEPVAIEGVTGGYNPEPNRIWASFRASAVLSNGDIVLEATTNPGNEYALWLLQPGRAPRRILRPGDSALVPTASGLVPAAVNSFSLPEGGSAGAQYSRGVDSWIGADGTILIYASLNTYGTTLLMARPSNPVDAIFADGFQ